jgi:hypothetical protein
VKGLFNDEGLATRGGGGGGGSNGRGGDNNGPHHSGNNSAWSSSSPPQQHHNDNQKKEAESSSSGAGRLLDRRDSSSPVPSGRIAVPAPLESPLSAHHSLPLFPQPAAAYPRGPPFSSLPPALYQTFTGFQRPDSANSKTTNSTATPTPSSVMSFGGGSKSELPSPSHTPSGGGRDSTNNSAYKFSPRRGIERDGGGSDLYDAVGKQEQLRRASPSSLRRSSSEAFGERCAPSPQPRSAKQLMSSDSTTGGGGGGDPSQSPSGRRGGFPNEPDRLRLKTEMPGSPVERKRTFSGEFSAASRDSLSHLSSSSGLPLTRAEAEGERKLLYGYPM